MGIRVAITGSTGRMGRLTRAVLEDSSPEFEVHALLDSRGELAELSGADIVFDVTTVAFSSRVVDFAVEQGITAVVGTSGWSADRIAEVEQKIKDAGRGTVVFVPNFSIGSVLMSRFAAAAAPFFGSIEIVEAHHAAKVDSPSGTAVRTAELIAQARTTPLSPAATEQRARGEVVGNVPIHSLRMTGVVAKQDVLLSGPGEILTLSHDTISAVAYEAGILATLRFADSAEGVVVGLDAVLGLNH